MKIEQTDFRTWIDVEYSGYWPCNVDFCQRDGVCRCFTINKTSIQSINFWSIVKDIVRQVLHPDSTIYELDEKINKLVYGFDRDFDHYCIERLCVAAKLYKEDAWEINIEQSYYGEGIRSVEIKADILQKLLTNIEDIFTLKTLSQRITFLLNEEYGFVPDSVARGEALVENVSRQDIRVSNEKHYQLIPNNLDYLQNRTSDIIGVATKIGSQYHLIDGHHRLKNTKETTLKIITLQ